MGNCFTSKQNNPYKKKLYVILPLSNPINFKRRQDLFDQTLLRLLQTRSDLCSRGSDVELEIVTVKLAYSETEQSLSFTNESNHFVLSAATSIRNALWSKENLINIAFEKLLGIESPAYVAWVDADIAFDSSTWVEDTVRTLDDLAARGGGFVQMFSQAHLLGPTGT